MPFLKGKTYITEQVTIPNTSTGIVLIAFGSTIKLKNSSTTYRILLVNASNAKIYGGTWDGNRLNQTVGDAYSSWAIGVGSGANDVLIDNCDITSVRGAGVKIVNSNRTIVQNCKFTNIGVSGTNNICYGVYAETSGNLNVGNKVLNCFFDFISSGTFAQPVLFTSGDNPYTGASTTNTQRDWQISHNYVLGSTSNNNTDSAICLCVRGRKGLVSNNITIGGSMGWSEGGPDTVITGNTFRDQTGNIVGSTRYGIEYSGARSVITSNFISGAVRGIENSFGTHGTTDDVIIADNYVEVDNSATLTGGPRCITLQIPNGATGRNTIIRNNILRGKTGVVTTYDVQGLSVQGNRFIGPGSGTGSTAVSFEGAPAQTFFDIQGNVFSGFAYVVDLYSSSAVTYTDLVFNNNNCNNDVTSSIANYVKISGSAVLGARILIMHNRQSASSSNFTWYWDRNVLRGIFVSDSGAPNGAVSASPGSLYLNTNGGATTTLYVKESGTGNTGWVAK